MSDYKPRAGVDARTRDGDIAVNVRWNAGAIRYVWSAEIDGITHSFDADGYLCQPQNHSGFDLVAEWTPAPSPDAGGWIKHTPGPCPVPPETMVEVKLRAGACLNVGRAKYSGWGDYGDATITHYRIVSPAPSAAPVQMVTSEPQISPMGWYYRCDGAARSIYRCKLGTAWEPMQVYDLGELTPAELRFIADAMEQESKV